MSPHHVLDPSVRRSRFMDLPQAEHLGTLPGHEHGSFAIALATTFHVVAVQMQMFKFNARASAV
jgi:hypothetical protein